MNIISELICRYPLIYVFELPAEIMVALSSEGPEQFKSLLKDAKCI